MVWDLGLMYFCSSGFQIQGIGVGMEGFGLLGVLP